MNAEPRELVEPPELAQLLDAQRASEPDDVSWIASTPPERRIWRPWPTWDPAAGAPGPVHGPRRDLPGGGKDIPWEKGARSKELVYWATADNRPPAAGITVVVTEGEKAADAVAEAGYEAVATVCGASSDPSEAVVRHLAAYQLVIAADNDEQGRRHMSRLVDGLELAGVAECRQVQTPTDAPEHWDLADVDIDERRRLIRDARPVALLPAIHSGGAAGMHFPTARELFAEVPERTSWCLDGLIADGTLTELDGPAKRAGKTTFVAHLVRAVLDGSALLGRSARKGPVVLLSEQPVASLRASLAGAGLLEREDLRILVWQRAKGQPWADVVAAAVDVCREIGAVLLVIDTLPQWAGLRGDAENDAGAALEAIAPLQAATSDGLAVLIVRHDRKGSGEVGESARGSSAFGGAVDTILQLRRGSAEERPTVRYLSCLSRFPEVPTELVIELVQDADIHSGGAVGMNAWRYVELGDPATYAVGEGKQAILVAVADAELPRSEIETQTGIRGERLTGLLAELVAGGFLERSGRGVKGDPQRFRRIVSIHSGGPFSLREGPPRRNEIEPRSVEVDDLTHQAVEIFGDDLAGDES